MFNYILLVILTILLVCSCGENEMDDVTSVVDGDGKVSGFVTLEWTGQSQTDGANILVYLGENQPSNDIELDTTLLFHQDQIVGDNWYVTITDSIGYYQFDDIDPIENWQIHLPSIGGVINATDNILDGDLDEEVVGTFINVSVEEDEHDDGNNFDAQFQSYAALSGQVLFEGSPATAEEHTNITLELYPADENGIADLDNLLETTLTNEAGYYQFEWLESGYYAVVIPYDESYTVVDARDTSADDDPLSNALNYIPVYLDWYEVDSNNNFYIVKNLGPFSAIMGHVIADNDGDGDPDIPVEGEIVELHKRGKDGLPSSLIDTEKTNAEGYYQFTTIDLDEYVIKYVGSGEYTCVESFDGSPETGEPINEDCQFIPTDITAVNTQDGDNLFIVE